MKKRILAAVLTLAMMFSLAVSASAANNVIRTEDVKISVDGKTIDVPQGSIWISEDGYTMVGARALAEGFGAKIVWDSATRTAAITGAGMADIQQALANAKEARDAAYLAAVGR